MTADEAMRRAIEVAMAGVEAGFGGPFGSVIVRDGQIVGRGENRVTSSNDPTAHAEIVAIRDACRTLGTHVLEGCDIYCSCEPCPMCLSAIYWARVRHVYFACGRTDAAAAGFDDEWIYREVALPHPERTIPITQLLRDEALATFQAWLGKPDRIEY